MIFNLGLINKKAFIRSNAGGKEIKNIKQTCINLVAESQRNGADAAAVELNTLQTSSKHHRRPSGVLIKRTPLVDADKLIAARMKL